MLFEEEDAPLLKKWIVKRLENTSDADADVLADYVLALLRHDGDDETVRALCEAEIPDFLKEDSALFVQDVFDAINYKTYLPGAIPQRKPNLAFDPPTGPSALQFMNLGVNSLTGAFGGSKKRSYYDRGNGQVQDKGFLFGGNTNDANKQPKRSGSSIGRNGFDGGRGRFDNGRGGYAGARSLPRNNQSTYSQYPEMHEISSPPSNLPIFDPNDPMTAMLAMQALGFPIPEIPQFAPGSLSTTPASIIQQNKIRCKDYDVKGFCARGNTCTFEHGEHPIWLPQCDNPTEEYDPTKSILTVLNQSGSKPKNSIENGLDREVSQTELEGKERGSKVRKGEARQTLHSHRRGGRSEFSSDRPNHDKSKTTIVVENIPEERFSENEVREFFSQFGKIIDISMRLYKRLAIIKYDDWSSAHAAYKSPKVIFDNRFVKVYWFTDQDSKLSLSSTSISGTQGLSSASRPPIPARETSEPAIDIEEFTRKQEEAQRIHLEKKKKKLEMEATMKELERRQEDLLKCQAEEKRKLMEKIAAKNGQGDSAENSKNEAPTITSKAQTQTEMLKAQLAALEFEAQSLGIDTTFSESKVWSSRGRGSSRGEQRGRGYSSRGFRGRYRGRGAASFVAPFTASARSFNLDNRPRKIGMTGIDFSDAEKDENLRQYLLGIGEYEEIEVTPSRTSITFKDRRTAEKFMYGTADSEIPSVGKVEMAWIQTPLPPVNVTTQIISPKVSTEEDSHMGDGDATATTSATNAGNGASFKQAEQQNTNSNMDYDVAYENEWEPE